MDIINQILNKPRRVKERVADPNAELSPIEKILTVIMGTGYRQLPQNTAQPTPTPLPSPTATPTPTPVPDTSVFANTPVQSRRQGAEAFIPIARAAEEARASESVPVPGLAEKLIAILDQESDFGSNPNAYSKNEGGDLGAFQINDVYTKEGQGAHGLYIQDKDRLDFDKSLQFANDFLTTFYRVGKRNGLSDEEAWAQAISAWNANPDYPGYLQGELDQLRREGLLE